MGVAGGVAGGGANSEERSVGIHTLLIHTHTHTLSLSSVNVSFSSISTQVVTTTHSKTNSRFNPFPTAPVCKGLTQYPC